MEKTSSSSPGVAGYPRFRFTFWCDLMHVRNFIINDKITSSLDPQPAMGSPSWRSASCLRIMKMYSASYLRLICFTVAGLGAPLSRFIEGVPHKFLNEWMNQSIIVYSEWKMMHMVIYCSKKQIYRRCRSSPLGDQSSPLGDQSSPLGGRPPS